MGASARRILTPVSAFDLDSGRDISAWSEPSALLDIGAFTGTASLADPNPSPPVCDCRTIPSTGLLLEPGMTDSLSRGVLKALLRLLALVSSRRAACSRCCTACRGAEADEDDEDAIAALVLGCPVVRCGNGA